MAFVGAILIKMSSTTAGLVERGVDVRIILNKWNMRTWAGFNEARQWLL
jgi:hypothetical protein